MLYHQNILEQVKFGSRALPASQIFSPATRLFGWRHSSTSFRSRKNQPFATAPWPEGGRPVTKVDCAVQVTAGVTVLSGLSAPRFASAARFGVCAPTRSGARPTTRMTRVRFMRPPRCFAFPRFPVGAIAAIGLERLPNQRETQ